MNFSLEKTEHYTLLKTELTDLNKEQAEELATIIQAHIAEHVCPYLILNLETVVNCNADSVRTLISIGQYLTKNDGMLIVSNPHESFQRLFDKAEIVFVPTDMEAIDYVYMDQIEKQFLAEE
jgi:hypothetical protein